MSGAEASDTPAATRLDLLPGYACRRFGDPSRPPSTLLLHGFTSSGADWASWPANAPAALAPDLPGHGASPAPASDFRSEIQRLLAALPTTIDRLAGYSLGGRIALSLLAAAPERFGAATIMAAHPGLINAGQREARRAADAHWVALLREQGIDAFVDTWERQPLFASQAALPAQVIAKQRRRRLAQRADGLAASLACFGLAEMPGTWEALVRWPGRLCWLAGARDGKFAAIAERIARERPRTDVRIIPGAGHNLLLEAPCAALAAALETGGAAPRLQPRKSS
ncbi:MAG: alpha/beta fold hydrolase [Thiohalocapsa sp.]|uniref:alpha/beta fold hydrolase n=1 Tax=Thiohalocapsa sp. TaxID=2497641 RepID=UPI0025EE4015|nr:alpha/beta fold hydrolase [Thiohalocapsa sp.]MCG6942927.1 alpha/beta fold hydrolase [Thiohalocapsa sp.]